MPQNTQPQIDQTALNLSRSIRDAEGGDYNNTSGDAGTSAGAYQWNNGKVALQKGQVPANFKSSAQSLGLDPNDFSQTNQDHVAYEEIKKDLDSGLSQSQIAAKWNSGLTTGWENHKGTVVINGKTISYDTPAYVNKVKNSYIKYSQGAQAGSTGLQPPTQGGQPLQQQSTAFNGALQAPTTPSTSSNVQGSVVSPQPGILDKVASGDYGGAALDAAKGVGNFLFPIAGDIGAAVQGKTDKSALQIAGDAGLSALTLIPGLGEIGKGAEAAGLAAKATPGLVSTLGKGAAYGASAGALSSLGQGNTDIGSIARDTAIGGVTGGALNGLVGRLAGGSGALGKSATEDITKVLAPTGKTDKLLTQKIAPELAKSGIMATSREGLLSKFQTKLGAAGDALESEYEKLPSDAKVEVGGLFETLQKKIDGLSINGVVPSAATSKVTALQNMMKDLANIGLETSEDGTKVFADVDNVRQLRQILDKTIQKNFGLTELDGAVKSSQKTLANSIRGAFADQYPDIGKLNKDFNFWSNATKVLQNTIDRKTGQSGLMRKGIAEGIGAAGGLASGHPIIGAGVMRVLSDFVSSPAYHTVSAALKSKIANAFEKGDYVGAGKLMQGIISAAPALAGRASTGVTGLISPPQK